MLGITAGLILPLATPDVRWLPVVLVPALVAALIAHRCGRVLPVWFCIGAVVTTLHAFFWQEQQLTSSCYRGEYAATFRISSFARISTLEDGTPVQRVHARLVSGLPRHCGLPREFLLAVYGDNRDLPLGALVAGEALLRPPPSQWSPGMIPDQARNAASGLDAVASFTVGRIDAGIARPLLDATRQKLVDTLNRAVPSGVGAGLLRALLVADGTGLDEEVWTLMRRMGLLHLLVISGLHIGLVAGFCWLLGGVLSRVVNRRGAAGSLRPRIVLTLLMALAYAGLAGFGVATQRALLMLLGISIARILGWSTRPVNGLLFAVVLILVLNPFAALSPGLWMSVTATALLLWLSQRPWAGGLAARLFLLQIVMSIVLLPMSWFWFGGGSLGAIITHLLVNPLITVWVLPLGLLGVVLAPVMEVSAAMLWRAALWPVPLMLDALHWMDQHLGEWVWIERHLSFSTALTALGGLLIFVRHTRWLAVALLIFMSFVVRTPPPLARLSVLDVGQGTAVVFEANGRHLLYDTGGGSASGFNQAVKVVAPLLRSAGADAIDTLMISHGDLDHSAGLGTIKSNFASERDLGWGGEPCRMGARWSWGEDVNFEVLHGDGHAQSNRNAHSCVLRIEAFGVVFLLAGDIPSRVELALGQYWREQLAADVLLVSHHGSGTSSSHGFLKWVKPAYAVLSHGLANRFGHPDANVVSRLQVHTRDMVSTAHLGTLRFEVDAPGALCFKPMRNRWTPFWLRVPPS
ncbi:DNA internalization-related competence protein ComEC/Rec2 [Luminiphilus syltensis NOR5-1B]|uniref:DNA internalization-related competence protein ComEC/Rec2 n=1 Tax=Luminiphilus syltensis NOR5-1B TaxID=565045 RepID=B8KYJ2_9GAMM|nr:DNA internalization-related competence protein ComEC/Rec2 [Luminiphilus syltensis]EED34934.1 DNA internalization-related competence protein ComEC/Rec2 [Luminiphilus syltensis NOR5-1B]